jgi:hypothetical protein
MPQCVGVQWELPGVSGGSKPELHPPLFLSQSGLVDRHSVRTAI